LAPSRANFGSAGERGAPSVGLRESSDLDVKVGDTGGDYFGSSVEGGEGGQLKVGGSCARCSDVGVRGEGVSSVGGVLISKLDVRGGARCDRDTAERGALTEVCGVFRHDTAYLGKPLSEGRVGGFARDRFHTEELSPGARDSAGGVRYLAYLRREGQTRASAVGELQLVVCEVGRGVEARSCGSGTDGLIRSIGDWFAV